MVGGGAVIPRTGRPGLLCSWPARLSVCACLGIVLVGLLAMLPTFSFCSIFEAVKDESKMVKKAVWGETSTEKEMEYTAGLKAALLHGQEDVDGNSFVPGGAVRVATNISYDLLKIVLECDIFNAEKFVDIVSEGCRGDFSSLLLDTIKENKEAENIVMSQAEQLGKVVEHLESVYKAVHNNRTDCYLVKEYECPQDFLPRQSELAGTRQRHSGGLLSRGDQRSVGIAVVAMIEDEIALEASKNNKIEYSKLHGYPLKFLEGKKVRGTDRPLAWAKVPFLLLQMMATLPSLATREFALRGSRPAFDYIWSLDLDTVITDMRQRIDEAVDTRYDIIISNDPNAINSGSFLLKNSAWTRLFLVTAWIEMDLPLSQWWWENAAIDDIGQSVYISNHIKKVKQTLFNSYERDIQVDGDGSMHLPFLVHFAGMSTKWIKVTQGCEYVRNNEYLLGLNQIEPDLDTS
eukprot:jgi/Picsp_1/4208/NSC_01717-R1_subunit of golgi mannosyltransferase complex